MANKSYANGSSQDPTIRNGESDHGNGSADLPEASGRDDSPGTTKSKPRGQRRPSGGSKPIVSRKGVSLLPTFAVIEEVISEGLYPYGDSEDPCWTMDGEAMDFLCGRTLDNIRTRQIPTIKLNAIEGGWQATIIDITLGYQCQFMFRLLDEFFEEFSKIRNNRRYWKRIAFGEGAQKRKAAEKKEFDELNTGVVK